MPNENIWILYDLLHNLLKPVVGAVDVNGRPVYTSEKPYLAASVVEGSREELYAIIRRLETAEEPQATETRPTITAEILEYAAHAENVFRYFERHRKPHLGPDAVRDLTELALAIGRLTGALQRQLKEENDRVDEPHNAET